MSSMRDKLATLSRAELGGLLVLVAVTLSGAGLWYMKSLPDAVAISAPEGSPDTATGANFSVDPGVSGVVAASGAPPTTASGSATVPSPPPLAEVIVDVAGFVRKPGVYSLAADQRVVDAIEKAGGPRKGAQLTTLNLAAPLVDGQQILVPEPLTRREAALIPGALAAGTTAVGVSEDGIVNINTADATQLETLSGIGEVLAAAIVNYREENGPFASADDLLDVSGIGDATLEEIRDQVTV